MGPKNRQATPPIIDRLPSGETGDPLRKTRSLGRHIGGHVAGQSHLSDGSLFAGSAEAQNSVPPCSHAPILPRIRGVSPMISGSEASFAGQESPTCNRPAGTSLRIAFLDAAPQYVGQTCPATDCRSLEQYTEREARSALLLTNCSRVPPHTRR